MTLVRGSHVRVAALLTATLALLAAPGGLWADESPPLPRGTTTVMGMPPFARKGSNAAEKAQWCEDADSWVAQYPDHPRALDLAFSATWARRWALWRPDCGDAFAALAPQYALDDPYGAVAWLEAARAHLGINREKHRDLGRARRALEAARTKLRQKPPIDAGQQLSRRWRYCRTHVEKWFEITEVELLGLEGRNIEAAKRLDELAVDAAWLEQTSSRSDNVLKRAARAYALGGARKKARQAIGQAIEMASSESNLAQHHYWRLCLDHNKLDEQGWPGIVAGKTTDKFMKDAHAMLRELQGNPHALKFPLSLGSTAFATRDYKRALEFYLMAIDDPALTKAALEDGSIPGALLVGFSAALAIDRFEDAERILEAVARIGNLPLKQVDQYRADIETAREDRKRAQDRKTRAEAGPKPDAAEPEKQRGPVAGRLRMPDHDQPYDEPTERDLGRDDAEDEDAPMWPWAAGIGLVFLLLAWARFRRR